MGKKLKSEAVAKKETTKKNKPADKKTPVVIKLDSTVQHVKIYPKYNPLRQK